MSKRQVYCSWAWRSFAIGLLHLVALLTSLHCSNVVCTMQLLRCFNSNVNSYPQHTEFFVVIRVGPHTQCIICAFQKTTAAWYCASHFTECRTQKNTLHVSLWRVAVSRHSGTILLYGLPWCCFRFFFVCNSSRFRSFLPAVIFIFISFSFHKLS